MAEVVSRRTIVRYAIGMALTPLVWACGGGNDDGTPSASPTAVGPQAFTINMELGMLVRGGMMPGRVEQQFERLIAMKILERV
mgnify:CR=1 FL=1